MLNGVTLVEGTEPKTDAFVAGWHGCWMLDVVDTEMWSKNVNEEMGYTYLGNVGDARNQLLRISIYENPAFRNTRIYF